MLETLAPLDREFTPYYWLTVLAVDRGSIPLSAVTEVYIEVTDINDNIPSMSRPVFYPSVQEDAPSGTSVLQLEARDPDSSSQGKLTFNLTSGNHMGHFVIHPFTGKTGKLEEQGYIDLQGSSWSVSDVVSGQPEDGFQFQFPGISLDLTNPCSEGRLRKCMC